MSTVNAHLVHVVPEHGFKDLTSAESHCHFETFALKYNSSSLPLIFYPGQEGDLDRAEKEVGKASSAWSFKTTSHDQRLLQSVAAGVDQASKDTSAASSKPPSGSKPVGARPSVAPRAPPGTVCQPAGESEADLKRKAMLTALGLGWGDGGEGEDHDRAQERLAFPQP